MLNKFAVVCEWPNIISAENEFIRRLQLASKKIRKRCIVIDSRGIILDKFNLQDFDIGKKIANSDVDFVINLHFASAKNYDGFSYIALWNPVQFYADWGYERYSSNLLTHHDAITALSPIVDTHFKRQVERKKTFHLNPEVIMHATNAQEVKKFDNDRKKIFYCGTNWDKTIKTRGLGVLKLLEEKNLIEIYGPKKTHKGRPWAGYKSYRGEIPFDGLSIFSVISKYRLSICFSHTAHLESEIISSRVFESIAGGAIPIVEENCVFAKRYFGDSLFYVDNTVSANEVAGKIEEIYKETLKNPEKAKDMLKRASEIMEQKFSLDKQLQAIFDGHEERKALVESKYLAKLQKEIINLYYIKFNKDDNLTNLFTSLKTQIYTNINIFILCQEDENVNIPQNSDFNISIIYLSKHLFSKNTFGKLFTYLFKEEFSKNPEIPVMLLTESDGLFYDHISSLARKLEDGEEFVVSDVTLDKRLNVKWSQFKVQENILCNINDISLFVPLGAILFKPKILTLEKTETYLRTSDIFNFGKILIFLEKQNVSFTNFSSMQVIYSKEIKKSFLQYEFVQNSGYNRYSKEKIGVGEGLLFDVTYNSFYITNLKIEKQPKIEKLLFKIKKLFNGFRLFLRVKFKSKLFVNNGIKI